MPFPIDPVWINFKKTGQDLFQVAPGASGSLTWQPSPGTQGQTATIQYGSGPKTPIPPGQKVPIAPPTGQNTTIVVTRPQAGKFGYTLAFTVQGIVFVVYVNVYNQLPNIDSKMDAFVFSSGTKSVGMKFMPLTGGKIVRAVMNTDGVVGGVPGGIGISVTWNAYCSVTTARTNVDDEYYYQFY